ncbi:acetylcholinesterase-like, partial [Sceloporus undulatus]|uniref:acetylcholinesterase-like n=1 Tax=Sceloporus undulatus TaxID=8520 RepID=UPI001C4C992A
MFETFPCLFLLFWLGFCSASRSDNVVVTSTGPIQGKHVMTESGMVTAFLGIPYAEPPVGELRFQKPHLHQPWSHVMKTTSFGNSCYSEDSPISNYHKAIYSEPILPVSEDCLFLNIWVPQPQPSVPASVLVWIHGGGFYMGTGSSDRSLLAATENIIVASMNYRLGSLGFLALPPGAPGNAGLWDQHLALSWLKENIAAFGGDPTRITIGGQSTGSASVGFHLLSPVSQYLFAQATLQSGAAIAYWAWVNPEEAKVRARTLGQMLGCVENDDIDVVNCLKRRDPGLLMQKIAHAIDPKTLTDLVFVPTTDGEFLPDSPQNLLEAWSIPFKPILTGFTPDESTIFLPNNAPGFSLSSESLISHKQLLEGLHLVAPKASDSAVEAAALIYTQQKDGDERYRNAMIKASGDHIFLCPMAELATRMAEAGSSVFAYIFTHRPPFPGMPDWFGVPHCAELPYLFGNILSLSGSNLTDTETETILSQRVMHYWGQFVRTGSPDGESGKEWLPYTGENFFRIDTEIAQPEEMSLTQYCGVWDWMEPKYPHGQKEE